MQTVLDLMGRLTRAPINTFYKWVLVPMKLLMITIIIIITRFQSED
jgi:hypothetical protein